MTAVPVHLRIGHMSYTVTLDTNEINKHNVNDQCDYAAWSRASEQRILMRDDMPPDYERETLLHEVIHQCLRVSGCDPDADAKAGVTDVEERAIKAMSGPLLGTLRDNPDLVAYLLDQPETSRRTAG